MLIQRGTVVGEIGAGWSCLHEALQVQGESTQDLGCPWMLRCSALGSGELSRALGSVGAL